MNPKIWTADDLDALQPSAARSPYGALASVHEMLAGAHLFEYQRGPDRRALVAVRPLEFSGGVRLEIVGLRSMAERLDGRDFHRAIDDLAGRFGARAVACCTQVPHVARSCLANGFEITGTILRKDLP